MSLSVKLSVSWVVGAALYLPIGVVVIAGEGRGSPERSGYDKDAAKKDNGRPELDILKGMRLESKPMSASEKNAIRSVARYPRSEVVDELLRVAKATYDSLSTRCKAVDGQNPEFCRRLFGPTTKYSYDDRPAVRSLAIIGQPAIVGILRRLKSESKDEEDEERMDIYALIVYDVLGRARGIGLLEKERETTTDAGRAAIDAILRRLRREGAE